jgi:RNA polymerase sigma-70 factor (ECF subfamily)
MEPSTAEIQQLRQIAQGDKHAFAQLLSDYLPPLLAFIKRFIKEPAQAEDIAQETFLRVWQRAGEWQPREHSPRSWVFRIAFNLCIDVIRKQKPTTDDIDGLVAPHSPETEVIAQNHHEHLHAAIDRLPERQRTALYLCAFHGLSNKEAAAIMQLGVDALESLLARARRSLRDYFSALEGERHEPNLSIIR